MSLPTLTSEVRNRYGLDLFKEIRTGVARTVRCDGSFIMVSEFHGAEVIGAAVQPHIQGFMVKPLSPPRLRVFPFDRERYAAAHVPRVIRSAAESRQALRSGLDGVGA